jgi:diaminopimelate decarboxylase
MIRDSMDFIGGATQLPKDEISLLADGELKNNVRAFVERRESFLSLVGKAPTPLYVIDKAALIMQAEKFRETFKTAIPDLKIFYAVKSNSHPLISATLLKEGLGLDVSSGLELEFALNLGAEEIVFSGPGKSRQELSLAVDNADRVTVLLDSFAELNRLDQVARGMGTSVTAGVRLSVDDAGIWRKFGIPLSQLPDFFKAADNCHYVDLSGLQFHLSWNMDSRPHVMFLSHLGQRLCQLKTVHRQQIRFIDIGGGFWPEQGEWLQPAATSQGKIKAALSESPGEWHHHYIRKAASIATFADQIGQALKEHLPDDIKCLIYTEPGRWLCHGAMHILLTVVDRKSAEVIITDGGTNAVGWERFESDYFPVINLSRPGLEEHPCLIAGSLCTPHDIWGYSYFGEGIEQGDIILVPDQGAYTYSLRQNFIKPLPETVHLDVD